MFEGFKKTKASKLWFSMIVVFVVILNVSYVEAKSLKKGEEFKEKSGGAIRVVSSDEVEIEQGPDILLGKYTIDGERVRIVINALGTAMVRYYKIIPDGLKEEKGGTIYYSKAGIANMRKRVQEEERKAALAAASRKYKDNGNGTITDNDTKLIWQKGESDTAMKWEPAISYCKGLSLAGHNDWRLPTIEELKSIADGRGPAINATFFPSDVSLSFWSSTTKPNGTSNALSMDGFLGNTWDFDPDFLSRNVRCVRDGTAVNTKSNAAQNFELVSAVFKGNTEIVKMLLDKGADANTKYKKTPLLCSAAYEGNAEIVKMLLGKGADANAKDESGDTALYTATRKGNTEIVKMLLDKGADANTKDSDGTSALHSAAHKGYTEIVKMLLDKGANVGAKDNDGKSVLHGPLIRGNIEIVKILLDKGANANAKDNDGTSLLYLAASYKKNPEIVKMLLENGADVSIKDSQGKTVFDYARDPKILEMLNKYAAHKKE